MKESNELLARFLGYRQPHPDYPNSTYWYKEGEEPLAILLFDNSWDWLMKVVEEISNILHYSLNATLDFLAEEQGRNGFLYTKEEVYKACVEFVREYAKK